ncbi:hypothetical protein [Cecembia rubra]|uniref:hypothetical protein n=1 Tax=Cecembia rubra TaxID=1485585 RepID=UPI002714C0CA|nr:hypothetical protein [Cecembia rubra]
MTTFNIILTERIHLLNFGRPFLHQGDESGILSLVDINNKAGIPQVALHLVPYHTGRYRTLICLKF